jgi:hypothetical protein
MNGQFYQKNTSKESAISSSVILRELLILMLFGFMITFVRARLRIPLHLPGHHGVEVMFFMMVARNFSKLPMASTLTTMSAAGFMLIPGFGYTDPFLPVVFIAFGVFIDACFRYFPKWHLSIPFVVIISGISYSFIPLSRFILVAFTNMPYDSILHGGFFTTLMMHFLFGSLGGFIAITTYIYANKLKSKKSETENF